MEKIVFGNSEEFEALKSAKKEECAKYNKENDSLFIEVFGVIFEYTGYPVYYMEREFIDYADEHDDPLYYVCQVEGDKYFIVDKDFTKAYDPSVVREIVYSMINLNYICFYSWHPHKYDIKCHKPIVYYDRNICRYYALANVDGRITCSHIIYAPVVESSEKNSYNEQFVAKEELDKLVYILRAACI